MPLSAQDVAAFDGQAIAVLSIRQPLIAAGIGAGTAIGGVVLVILSGTLSDRNQPFGIASRWWLDEPSPGHLVVRVFGPCPMQIDIQAEPNGGELEALIVSREQGEPVFSYQVQGSFGVAAAQYTGSGARGRFTWIDWNADGWFDQRYCEASDRSEIRLGGRWVEAAITDSLADTAEGRFEFDVASGEWQRATGSQEACDHLGSRL